MLRRSFKRQHHSSPRSPSTKVTRHDGMDVGNCSACEQLQPSWARYFCGPGNVVMKLNITDYSDISCEHGLMSLYVGGGVRFSCLLDPWTSDRNCMSAVVAAEPKKVKGAVKVGLDKMVAGNHDFRKLEIMPPDQAKKIQQKMQENHRTTPSLAVLKAFATDVKAWKKSCSFDLTDAEDLHAQKHSETLMALEVSVDELRGGVYGKVQELSASLEMARKDVDRLQRQVKQEREVRRQLEEQKVQAEVQKDKELSAVLEVARTDIDRLQRGVQEKREARRRTEEQKTQAEVQKERAFDIAKNGKSKAHLAALEKLNKAMAEVKKKQDNVEVMKKLIAESTPISADEAQKAAMAADQEVVRPKAVVEEEKKADIQATAHIKDSLSRMEALEKAIASLKWTNNAARPADVATKVGRHNIGPKSVKLVDPKLFPKEDHDECLRQALGNIHEFETTAKFTDALILEAEKQISFKIGTGLLEDHPGFTQCSAKAVATFTVELQCIEFAATPEDEFYRVCGEVVRVRKPQNMVHLRGWSFYFISGMRALPQFKGVLWRGIRGR